MISTLSGIVIEASDVQPAKALLPIHKIESGTSIADNDIL